MDPELIMQIKSAVSGSAMSAEEFSAWLDGDSQIAELQNYRNIGWDVDATIYEHPHASFFWRYIADNPFDQRHHIITFRTGRMVPNIWRDLARAGSQLLPLHFHSINSVPEEMWLSFQTHRQGLHPYPFWKGKTCRELGIDVLIDDATMDVWAGCSEYQIEYFHPDMLG